jgi:putative transposase
MRNMIETGHPDIPIYRQCELLGFSRSSYYYMPVEESPYNLLLMSLIDKRYTLTPFYGVPRMTDWLRRKGHQVNPKRVARLMSLMGIQAIYPKPKTSLRNKEHKIYPYLLNGLLIERVNQVWATDISVLQQRRA